MVVFDPENLDAAFEELDARYLAGEAAAHSHTWSVITRLHAAFNRREVPDAKPRLNDRPSTVLSIEAGDPTAQIRDMWDFTRDVKVYIEAVHRLGDLGAVFTQASHGTSQAGFDAEWRLVELVTIDGDLANRGELFDEAQIDAALARFDELNRQAKPSLDNAATPRRGSELVEVYNRHDIDGWLALTTTDGRVEDRRKGLRFFHIGIGPAWQKTMRAWLQGRAAPAGGWMWRYSKRSGDLACLLPATVAATSTRTIKPVNGGSTWR